MKILPTFASAVRPPRKRFAGFTLIELLATMAIVLVLAAILAPVVKSARMFARKSRCTSNMQQFGVAFRLYQADHRGMYPNPWVDNENNWQSYLCGALPFSPWVGPNKYLPSEWATYTGAPAGAKRVIGKFLCPEITKTYNIPDTGQHGEWGYCYNETRTRISYDAGGWPWFLIQYANVDLDDLYKKSAVCSVMVCGNRGSSNTDNNWDAFSSGADYDWVVIPVHGDMANTLFMDGHVSSLNVVSADGKLKFNQYWYGGIPSTWSNPWTSY